MSDFLRQPIQAIEQFQAEKLRSMLALCRGDIRSTGVAGLKLASISHPFKPSMNLFGCR